MTMKNIVTMKNIEKNEKLKIKEIQLAATVFVENNLISDDLPKIIFIGRSNVGKSSFINKLINRKNFARTSSSPGKTISINYYLINRKFYFVDLPGYGYARISQKEAQRIRRLITFFFEKTMNIRLVLILIDSRRGFMNSDIEILAKILNKEFRMLTVLTKSDKIKNSELAIQKNNLQKEYGLRVITFSIKSKDNYEKREEILKKINEAIME